MRIILLTLIMSFSGHGQGPVANLDALGGLIFDSFANNNLKTISAVSRASMSVEDCEKEWKSIVKLTRAKAAKETYDKVALRYAKYLEDYCLANPISKKTIERYELMQKTAFHSAVQRAHKKNIVFSKCRIRKTYFSQDEDDLLVEINSPLRRGMVMIVFSAPDGRVFQLGYRCYFLPNNGWKIDVDPVAALNEVRGGLLIRNSPRNRNNFLLPLVPDRTDA